MVDHGLDLQPILILLAAGVVAVPLFKRFALDSVIAYLCAGILIGPFALGLFKDPENIVHVSELGVVLFLFLIGLEMQPSRLWGMRRDILGLGLVQLLACSVLLTATGVLLGYRPPEAFVLAIGFVLTSTAIVMQLLKDRGDLAQPLGRRIVSILLLEDLAIVPLLAVLSLIAPSRGEVHPFSLMGLAFPLLALGALLLVGRYLLNPLFRILSKAGAREVMTAAALLVVMGAAYAMQLSGLSMALGAFLAGVLLSESTFRHQLEADVEPFRGILLGLFFLAVGMSLNLGILFSNWQQVALCVAALMVAKATGVYSIARLLRTTRREAVERAILMAQGGEFAFVFFSAASAAHVIDAKTAAIFTSAVIISMAITPVAALVARRLLPSPSPSLDGVQSPDGLKGNVLIIGFGRFGQFVSQPLLARGIEVSIIDKDVEQIKTAAKFGFKVYYGDGTRLDILRAAGVANTQTLMICVDSSDAAVRIAELVRAEFPSVPIMARSFDRRTSLALLGAGIDYEIRETLESAFEFGRVALIRLGATEEEAAEIVADARRSDSARLRVQMAEGLYSGRHFVTGNTPVPAPLTKPQHEGTAGNADAARLLAKTDKANAPS